MLIARGCTTLARAELKTCIAFGHTLVLSIVARRGLRMDSAFVPALMGGALRSCLYVLLEGRWETQGAEHDVSFAGPTALLLSSAQLEGAMGRRPFTFVNEGEPYRAIEFHVFNGSLRSPPSSMPRVVPLRGRTLELCESVFRAANDDVELERTTAGLVTDLVAEGVIEPSSAEAMTGHSAVFAGLWRALRPILERHYLSPTLQQISEGSGLSVRQFDRTLRTFIAASPIGLGETWRATARRLRIRVAVLFLSAEGVTIGEVSRAVGYGSVDAMARAFRDLGMPAPGVVQHALLARRAGPEE